MVQRILVISPHPDDGEIGCGASIAKFVREGNEVTNLLVSISEHSLNKNILGEDREEEFMEANKLLGASPEAIYGLEGIHRRFYEVRQRILDAFCKDIKWDLVFIPNPDDLHQDHQVTAMEAMRAFKQSTILAYEVMGTPIAADFFIEVSIGDVCKKEAAIAKYKSVPYKQYFEPGFFQSLATVRGAQIRKPYAEAFKFIRGIM